MATCPPPSFSAILHNYGALTAQTILPLALGAILLAALLQVILRRGQGAASLEAPESLRNTARLLIVAGTWMSLTPLIPLVFDAFVIRSFAYILGLVVFLIVSVALILLSWIWLRRVWQRSRSRSVNAFVIGTALANMAIALVLYRGFLSGEADSQDGIVVQVVPILQLVITATLALLRRALEQSAGVKHASG